MSAKHSCRAGMKTKYLKNLSTITIMDLNPSTFEKPEMKSIEINCQGRSRIGKGWSNLPHFLFLFYPTGIPNRISHMPQRHYPSLAINMILRAKLASFQCLDDLSIVDHEFSSTILASVPHLKVHIAVAFGIN